MSEAETTKAIDKPHTKNSLARKFREFGVEPNSTVIVHSSLSSLGWVCGGPIAVIQALMEVVTPKGNIVMPTHSSEYSEPSHWQAPPVPESWWEVIRSEMPGFDPKITPTRGMGSIPENFRNFEGVKRSNHPTSSFAAWGAKAGWIVDKQPLGYPMGENSPLAKIYELNGSILLIGVGHDSNTSLHLAESRIADFPVATQGGPILNKEGGRIWATYTEPDYDADRFPEFGAEFEKSNKVKVGKIGKAEVRLINQRAIVDFAVEHLSLTK